jgi:hypothetical protein
MVPAIKAGHYPLSRVPSAERELGGPSSRRCLPWNQRRLGTPLMVPESKGLPVQPA